ncbi:MAG: type II toxin-antitoxin system RelE/ParE family toxin, partial [Gallionella sp.]|nr:type II toxin-antitoxin system RelE/ParE family toxin [Gallionella sp.]
MRLIFRPEAERELLQAQAWYESISPGLGLEFAQAAETAIAAALRNPSGHRRIQDDFRRVLFRKFPYSLVYMYDQAELVVVSCFHH